MTATASLFVSTTVAASPQVDIGTRGKTIHAWGTTSAGAGAATINIEASNDLTAPWLVLGIISLTLGTTATADGFAIDAPWKWTRANVTAISGTNASVSVSFGV